MERTLTDATNSATGSYMNRPNKTAPLSHRLDPKMKEQLQRLADADRRSLTSYIELVLADHIDKVDRAKKRATLK